MDKTRAPARSASLKHERVLNVIRRRIENGQYSTGMLLPTGSQLSKALRVGKQTVVRALGELAREGIIVRRRGDGTYVADRQRPPLLPGKTLRIGLLWNRSILPERLYTSFQGAITRGILETWGIDAVLPVWSKTSEREPTRVTWTSAECAATVEVLGESLLSRTRYPDLQAVKAARFDALITLSIIREEWLQELLALKLPTVIVDFPSNRIAPQADSVFVDGQAAYREAIFEMAAQGLKKIHFLGAKLVVPAPSPEMTPEAVRAFQAGKHQVDPDSYLRLGAWHSAMTECGLEAPDSHAHFEFYQREAQFAERLLALPPDRQPDGFVCHDHRQAEALCREWAKRGKKILAAGATDTPVAGSAWPILIDGLEVGHAAANLLLWKLRQPERAAMRLGVAMSLGAKQPTAVSTDMR